MTWTTPDALKAQLIRYWDRGELLRPLVASEAGFPLRLSLKAPGSIDLTHRFEVVRAWTAELAAMPHIRIAWHEVRHRIQGLQSLPAQIWIDSRDDALALIGKRRDAERFVQLVERTRAALPVLLPWLAKHPLRAVELADRWPRLTAVVQWLIEHPRPGIYLRQVDVPGVHSKFIEEHRVVLSELLDLALPEGAVQGHQKGVGQFGIRYGFLDKPNRIRFRVLDRTVRLLPGTMHPDVALDAESFACLDLEVGRVFITENEINFLAFPPARDAIVIFGAGYGWETLARTRWLSRCAIHYWGDIDTHGFAILDRLRSHFDHVSSFLMDRETLNAHALHWGDEPVQLVQDLPRLTAEERALFNDLRDNRIRMNLRLEQERVGFQWVTDALSRLTTI
ncbi:MAG TPA: Wadjet anti-phage system protein JetD domain-containing protein [Dongiaceae bacterium]|nr:Wadjet anti-phage system protein JetD domain-containing protein [Dongiaceae bacterium]